MSESDDDETAAEKLECAHKRTLCYGLAAKKADRSPTRRDAVPKRVSEQPPEQPRFGLWDVKKFRPQGGVVLNDLHGTIIATTELTADEAIVVVAWMRGLDQLPQKKEKNKVTVLDLKQYLDKNDIPPTDITKYTGPAGFWVKYIRRASNKGYADPIDDVDLQSVISSFQSLSVDGQSEDGRSESANSFVDASKVVSASSMLPTFFRQLVNMDYPTSDFEKLATLISQFPDHWLDQKWVKFDDLPVLQTPKKKKVPTEAERNKKLLGSMKKKLDKVCVIDCSVCVNCILL
jgi:hypothetical protein